jgi:phage shock protein E
LVLALLSGCASGSNEQVSGTAAAEPVGTESPAVAETSADTSVTPTGVGLVSVEVATKLLADETVTVLDLRTPEEFASGHLNGASMLDFYEADFQSKLSELDRNKKYLVYCRSGNRSGQATVMMKELGFAQVADLDGGILAWEAAGKFTAV